MVNKLKWTSVSKKEVENAKFRLEASVFNIDAKVAKKIIESSKFPKVKLWSDQGLIKNAFYPGRFKRIYVKKGNGYPMILPSQMLDINPTATKFISEKTYNSIGSLNLTKDQLLLTRSGTIGNCTLVSKTLENKVMSDDVIRITFKENFDIGFVYAFLKTKIGQIILTTNNYGSVIQHIEPEHLEEITIPKPDVEIRNSIHQKIIKSFELRDQSNDLIEYAENLLKDTLKLPLIDNLNIELFDNNSDILNFVIPANFLENRLDSSFHHPEVNSIMDLLLDNAKTILSVCDGKISKNIILPGRFKRIYVDEDNGTVFLGGKQIFELDPSNKKYLSIKKHKDRIAKQLYLYENMIVITCSGTIGRVNIIPKHWENWTMSQHVLRIVPANNKIAGYLYIWLNSDYGKSLIQRHIYGSVVDEIDNSHLSKVPVPILHDEQIMQEINQLALQANKLRSEAYYEEQKAIRELEEKVFLI
jgi:type I restriction enzyme, S subunit